MSEITFDKVFEYKNQLFPGGVNNYGFKSIDSDAIRKSFILPDNSPHLYLRGRSPGHGNYFEYYLISTKLEDMYTAQENEQVQITKDVFLANFFFSDYHPMYKIIFEEICGKLEPTFWLMVEQYGSDKLVEIYLKVDERYTAGAFRVKRPMKEFVLLK